MIDLTALIKAANGFGKAQDADDTDFLYPEHRRYPINSRQDVQDALDDYYEGDFEIDDTRTEFVKKLWKKAKEKHLEDGISQPIRDEFDLEP